MKIQRIGIVGSGQIGGTLGVMLAKAGHEVLFSSRHPEQLDNLVKASGKSACAGTVDEAVQYGEVVILSLPLKAVPELDSRTKSSLKGKIVIDTSNPYPERDGALAEKALQEPGGMGTFIADLLPGARVVRAFNTVYYKDLRRTRNDKGKRIGVPIASDDREGLDVVRELVERIGLAPVVTGGLTTSKSFDVGTSVYATSASADEIRKKLGLKAAPGIHAA